VTTPDLRNDIFDALGVGHGTSGKVLQAVETFLLADNFIPSHVDEQGTHDLVWPTLLHTGSGRRFEITVKEIHSDTPPEPARIGEGGEVTPTPGEFTPPELAAEPPPPERAPASEFKTLPPEEDEPLTANPNEPIDATSPHQAQPAEPESNVDLDFLARVEKHDEQLKPGAPLPVPGDPQFEK
jgi:hypothetical protein